MDEFDLKKILEEEVVDKLITVMASADRTLGASIDENTESIHAIVTLEERLVQIDNYLKTLLGSDEVGDVNIDAKYQELLDIKQKIVEALENKKGQPLGDPDNCNSYVEEINNLYLETPKYGTYEWYREQRDPKWLEIEHLVTEEDRVLGGKIVLLYQVPKTGAFIRFTGNDRPNVDWGDGTITEGDISTAYRHTIDWEDLSEDTLLDNGNKQAIVTITPKSSPITYFIPTRDDRKYGESAVEIVILSTFMKLLRLSEYEKIEFYKLMGENSITESVSLPRNLKYMERSYNIVEDHYNDLRYLYNDPIVEIDITNGTRMSFMLYNMRSNLNAKLIGTPINPWTGDNMYSSTYEMMEIKEIDYKLCTTFYSFAYNCSWLERTPLIDMQSSTNNLKAFERCYYLNEINLINCKSSISFYLCYRLPLSEIIDFGKNGIVDLTGLETQDLDIRLSRPQKELTDLGDDGVYTHDGVDYTKEDILSIFIDKNWTVTL